MHTYIHTYIHLYFTVCSLLYKGPKVCHACRVSVCANVCYTFGLSHENAYKTVYHKNVFEFTLVLCHALSQNVHSLAIQVTKDNLTIY